MKFPEYSASLSANSIKLKIKRKNRKQYFHKIC